MSRPHKGLRAAWAEAEAALPVGWRFLYVAPGMYDGDNELVRLQWFAIAVGVPFEGSLGPEVRANPGGRRDIEREGRGDTPAAALRDLAAKLREKPYR